MGLPYISCSFPQGFQAARYRIGVFTFRPQVFKQFFRQESGGKVSLRIQIRSQNSCAKVCIHPGEVINKRSFADSTLITKKSDNWDRFHRLLSITAKICPSST